MRFFLRLAFSIMMLLPFTAEARYDAAKFGPEDVAALKRIEAYFNNIKTLTADFSQLVPRTAQSSGGISTGKLYLSRPGKIRWEYQKPQALVIIINGVLLTYYDVALKQVSYTKADSMLSEFLIREKIAFDSPDIEVTSVKRDEQGMQVSLKEAKGEGMLESLSLSFVNDANFHLRMLRLLDMNGRMTTVEFTNLATNQAALDKSLFVIQNPKLFNQKPGQKRGH